ncbi:MAG: hypothetical protein KKF44_07450 [Nanoarchaeota archaeon]|nr:hypothetical protein [Nanoarchaeota archaeon]
MGDYEDFESGLEAILMRAASGIASMQKEGDIPELTYSFPFLYQNRVYSFEILNQENKQNQTQVITMRVKDLEPFIEGDESKYLNFVAGMTFDDMKFNPHMLAYYNATKRLFSKISFEFDNLRGTRDTILKADPRTTKAIHKDSRKGNAMAQAFVQGVENANLIIHRYNLGEPFFNMGYCDVFNEKMDQAKFLEAYQIALALSFNEEDFNDFRVIRHKFSDWMAGIVHIGLQDSDYIAEAKRIILEKLVQRDFEYTYPLAFAAHKIARKYDRDDFDISLKQAVDGLREEYRNEPHRILRILAENEDHLGLKYAFYKFAEDGEKIFLHRSPYDVALIYPEYAVPLFRSAMPETLGFLKNISVPEETRFEKGNYVYHVHELNGDCPLFDDRKRCTKNGLKPNMGYTISRVYRHRDKEDSIKLEGLTGLFKPSEFTHYYIKT